MLGKKRFGSKGGNRGGKRGGTFKAKSYTKKQKHDDEEIISDDDEMNKSQSEDGFFQKEENSEDENFQKETIDTKRLKMARKLITEIEGKMDDDANSDDDENKRDLDGYLKEQKAKENKEYQQAYHTKINPKHQIFLKGHLSSVTSVDISSDSKQLISAGKDCRAIKWDLETNKKFLLPQFTKRSLLTCVCFH